jgi:WD40 repeat protein
MVSAAFSADGQRLVTGSMVGGELQPAVEVWDIATGRGLLSLRSQGRFTGWTEFSPDGNTLLALSWHGATELWRAPSWAEIEAAERGDLTR